MAIARACSAFAAMVLGLAACTPDFDVEPHDPDTAGEISHVRPGERVNYELELADGTLVPVDVTGSNVIFGGAPEEGALYLGGGPDGARWHAFLRWDGCWQIYGEARNEGERLWFRNGLRLPISADMDFGFLGEVDEYGDPSSTFCVNESGEVTRYGTG